MSAKTQGFCFGVDRSIKIVNNLLKENKNICTLGSIIHNPEVVKKLETKGVKIIGDPSELPDGFSLVIRSHGVSKNILDYITERSLDYKDATCPFVKKIHKIVKNNNDKDILLAAGSENHPEMIGIRSYFNKKSYVFSCLEELRDIFKNHPEIKNKKIIVVSQTTFSYEKWLKCTEYLKGALTNICIFDTICSTTYLRQKEAEDIAKVCDVVLVVGGKKSSNTNKLCDICSKYSKAFLIENEKELYCLNLENIHKVGIVSGASTSMDAIKKVRIYLENNCE
ncbi:MAG: 4-hydroxy-3-methylbut-2-enyl diphosphate reductase [Acutalibacteraceae bacterium]